MSSGQLDILRHLLSDATASNNIHRPSNLTFSQRNAAKQLKSNNYLVLTKAEKGGQMALLDKCTYLNNVKTLLEEGPLAKIRSDPTTKNLTKIENVVKNSENC